jgi:hypothetical protein
MAGKDKESASRTFARGMTTGAFQNAWSSADTRNLPGKAA